MGKKDLTKIIVMFCAIAGLFPLRSRSFGQVETSFTLSTQINAGGRFIGASKCAECHRSIAIKQRSSIMAKALQSSADCEILSSHPQLTFRNGPYSYRIVREADRSIYAVTDGVNTITIPILYCFGYGKTGQTYVLEYKGAYYESRVSFFPAIQGLDFTLGAPRSAPKSLEEAIGQVLMPKDTERCFNCHATAAVGSRGLQLDHLMAGVNCESCHGPGEKHVAAMTAGGSKEKHILNPGKVSSDEMSQQVCGSCHRSWEEVMLMPDRGGITNVRFHPYRLANSKCYKNPDDRRIGCTACHDPHGDLKEESAFYDSRCLACHLSKSSARAERSDTRNAPPCPVGNQKCATCHMPKTELPGAHFKFTDHYIRVARPGAPYPK